MLGLTWASQWGYSLWEFKVFNKDRNKKQVNPLSDVYFIKLELHDKQGKLISNNFYWHGNEYLDYTALNSLYEVDLEVISSSQTVGDMQMIIAAVTSPKNVTNMLLPFVFCL